MKLKTLNDLEKQFIGMPHWAQLHRILKAEAVKWIKDRADDDGMPLEDLYEFFNLTEDELKKENAP